MGFGSVIKLIISVIMVMKLGGVIGYKNYDVGGTATWRVPEANDTSFFDHWASSKPFHVGDSLHFVYKNDSVMEVDKYGYYHCKTNKHISYHDDGNTYIKLDRPALTYFISGFFDHCNRGQRLAVDVKPPPHSLSPMESPSPSPTPQPYQPPAGSPTTAPEAAPQTHKSGAATIARASALLGLVAASLFLV